ncbi:hypothetical protein WAF17_02645 [Bernardetia sp. ABR2-2B]|uniref:hypothetical protein n=1 Tax=Bernardetia sp. ABR2-2B TaxID=3127472 RepID=UPI0030CCCC65
MNTSQVESLKEFEFKGKIRDAFLVEGRIVWFLQSYPDFLTVNKDFYGSDEKDNAKRMFWLKCKKIQRENNFRCVIGKNKKPIWKNGKAQISDVPCKWEIIIYIRELDYPIKFCKNFFDHDSLRTIQDFLVKEIFGRINPNGQIKRQRPDQTFVKALIFDRETDENVFQYPAPGIMILDVEESRKELLRVCKHFKEKKSFPPQEHYSLPDLSEQEFKATPKIFKEDTTDYSTIFLQMKEAMYSELVRLNLAEYIADVANIKFHSFQNNSLKCFIDSKAQFDKLEQDRFLVVFRQFQIRFFGESVKLEYVLKTPIQKSETQPKTAETKVVELERSEAEKIQKRIKRHANPDRVFTATMIDFNRNSNVKLIEFQSLELKFRNDDEGITHLTLPNEHLIEAFMSSEYRVFFDKAHEKNFGGTYKIVLRHEPIDVSFLNLKPKRIL